MKYNYYFYSFNEFAGIDKIFSVITNTKLSRGDLIFQNNKYYLNIGTKINNKELYEKYTIDIKEFAIIEKKLLNKKSLDMADFLVKNYYSSYKNVINLYLNNDVLGFLKRKNKKIDQINIKEIALGLKIDLNGIDIGNSDKQNLLIFPDLWSLKNSFEISEFKDCLLHGQNTQFQKDKIFWSIKQGKLKTLISTHSQIFQDWHNLENIIVFDMHKWYYKNQKDPRYSLKTVVNKMSEIYGAQLLSLGLNI